MARIAEEAQEIHGLATELRERAHRISAKIGDHRYRGERTAKATALTLLRGNRKLIEELAEANAEALEALTG